MAGQPFNRAAGSGHAAVSAALIQNGASLFAALNESQETPLHVAAQEGQAEVVTVLLTHGASPLARDFEGKTPLHGAAPGANADVVKILLDGGLVQGHGISLAGLRGTWQLWSIHRGSILGYSWKLTPLSRVTVKC